MKRRRQCKHNCAANRRGHGRWCKYRPRSQYSPHLARAGWPFYLGMTRFTRVSASAARTKDGVLQANRTFNPRSARVRHALFQQPGFFDPADLIQLKYEALRSLQTDGYSISRAAEEFGLSRPTIYQAQAQLEQNGIEGLLPHKRGPRKPRKLIAPVLEFVQETLAADPEVGSGALAEQLRKRFGAVVHPRTLEKALKFKAKRGRPKNR